MLWHYIHLALLQICSTPIRVGLLSPVTVLLSGPVRGLLPQVNRDPININNCNMHDEAIEACQRKLIRARCLNRYFCLYCRSYSNSPAIRLGGMDTRCNSQTQQWWPQGMFLYHTGDIVWQTHHTGLEAHMQHQCSLRGVLAGSDQKGIELSGGHFCTSDIRGIDWVTQTTIHGHCHRGIHESKLVFPNQGRKSLGNSHSPWYGGQWHKSWEK